MLIKRSFSLAGHRTSVALEDAFWQALTAIALRDGMAVAALVAQIDAARAADISLASALRVRALQDAHTDAAAENSSRNRACD